MPGTDFDKRHTIILFSIWLLLFACSTPKLPYDYLTRDHVDEIAGKDWRFYAIKIENRDKPVFYYYHIGTLSYPSEGMVRVWTKSSWIVGDRIYFPRFLLEIDCLARRYRVLYSELFPPPADAKLPWHYIVPDSNDELLYDILCR